MAQTLIHKDKCDFCGKVAREKSHEHLPELGITSVTLECGHTIIKDLVKVDQQYNIVSSDGRELYNFQKDGVKFLENAGGRALIADEMGLGKTVQALAWIKLHVDEACPVLIIPKSRLKLQWFRESLRWLGPEFCPLLLDSGHDRPMPGFKIYICPFDLLRRIGKRSKKKDDHVLADILGTELENWDEIKHVNPLISFPFKTIIIDETQQIKNSGSIRTQEVRKLAKDRKFIIGLSGTPAKNHAGEMFSILNIINPTRFPDYVGFIRKFCDQYFNGYTYKVSGIRDLDYFREYTSDMMIRRERAEVLPDLPLVNRVFQNVEVESKSIRKAYEQEQEEFEDMFYENESSDDREGGFTNILAKMSRLRHLAGLAKVEHCVERVAEFLETVENEKIFVFSHHIDVANLFENNLNAWLQDESEDGGRHLNLKPVVNLVGVGADLADAKTQSLKDDPLQRVVIASSLASGEGLNLQFISNCIMLERQWNPANEEQAEARFPRPGQTAERIDATYMIAAGTIDEFFTELVEKKREWIKSIHKETDYHWDESSLMKELAAVVAAKGKGRFNIRK